MIPRLLQAFWRFRYLGKSCGVGFGIQYYTKSILYRNKYNLSKLLLNFLLYRNKINFQDLWNGK